MAWSARLVAVHALVRAVHDARLVDLRQCVRKCDLSEFVFGPTTAGGGVQRRQGASKRYQRVRPVVDGTAGGLDGQIAMHATREPLGQPDDMGGGVTGGLGGGGVVGGTRGGGGDVQLISSP